jgi:hypothetical protein
MSHIKDVLTYIGFFSLFETVWNYIMLYYSIMKIHFNVKKTRDRHGRDRMVVGFTTL